MNKYGFQIRRLALTGPDKKTAEVEFNSGLNIISGPSDTGKTFILRCIDYVLGASDRPDEIPEAKGYYSVAIEIEAMSSNIRYVLERALRGGDVTLTLPEKDSEILKSKHSPKRTDTISHFLLDLMGLSDRQIRTNAEGKTRGVSFRDIAHLTIVQEQDVIDKSSPVRPKSGYDVTALRSVFRLLLTGMDDSAVATQEKARISRARVEAKTDELQGMLDQLRDQIADQQGDVEATTLKDQLNRLEGSYQTLNKGLSESGSEIEVLEQQRQIQWSRIREVKRRLEILLGLSERFSLLSEQYQSDLRRLEAIAEAGSRLRDIGTERCPVCGALPEHHEHEHVDSSVRPEVVTESATMEADKIRVLIADLKTTREDVESEHKALLREQQQLKEALSDVAEALEEKLRPRAQEVTRKLQEVAANRQQVQYSIDLLERAEALENRIKTVQSEEVATARQEFASLPTSAAEEFAQEVEARLAAWSFPELDRVTFSDTEWDVIISGRLRTSHGKGVRAVTHAAFTTALMHYCIERELPHPGLVLIDSPLVVYEAPDSGEEEFSQDVQSAFIADLEQTFTDSQVIIFENTKSLPDDLESRPSVNLIQFSKTSQGRYGFIPVEGAE